MHTKGEKLEFDSPFEGTSPQEVNNHRVHLTTVHYLVVLKIINVSFKSSLIAHLQTYIQKTCFLVISRKHDEYFNFWGCKLVHSAYFSLFWFTLTFWLKLTYFINLSWIYLSLSTNYLWRNIKGGWKVCPTLFLKFNYRDFCMWILSKFNYRDFCMWICAKILDLFFKVTNIAARL